MFEENELAVRLQDTSDAPNGLYYTWNCAQRKSAHHCIDTRVRQRNAFSGQV